MFAKRILLVIIVFLAGCASVCAQDFSFGVKAGVAGNRINRTNLVSGERVVPNIGFYAGIAGNVELSDLMFAQAELLFARKGMNKKHELFGSYSRNISYLQLPLFVGFKLGSDDLRLMLGPEFGLCVGGNVKRYENAPEVIEEMVAPFNLAVAVQVNYMFADELGLDFKVDYGVTRTFRNDNVKGLWNDGRNLSVQLGLCYFF